MLLLHFPILVLRRPTRSQRSPRGGLMTRVTNLCQRFARGEWAQLFREAGAARRPWCPASPTAGFPPRHAISCRGEEGRMHLCRLPRKHFQGSAASPPYPTSPSWCRHPCRSETAPTRPSAPTPPVGAGLYSPAIAPHPYTHSNCPSSGHTQCT